jgi:LiaI-LiaF-like transmembrane region
MQRFDFRLAIGGILILTGALLLLQQMGIISGNVSVIWASLLIASGLVFLGVFIANRQHWWALIPGMTLLGLGIIPFLPAQYTYLGGSIMLGAVGLSFFIIYFSHHEHWWAIIPGGVLLTLAVCAYLAFHTGSQLSGIRIDEVVLGSAFFLGLALTFLLVAILPNPSARMKWAFIPSAALLLTAFTAASFRLQQIMIYVWPVALVAAGLYLIYLYFQNRK